METIIKGHVYIAVDFDGTITTERDDNFGQYKLQPYCKEVLLKLHSTGKVHFGLWTCRSNGQLEIAKNFLKEVGLYDIFETFNKSFEEVERMFDTPSSGKMSCDLYIDDRTIYGVPNWLDVLDVVMKILHEGV